MYLLINAEIQIEVVRPFFSKIDYFGKELSIINHEWNIQKTEILKEKSIYFSFSSL